MTDREFGRPDGGPLPVVESRSPARRRWPRSRAALPGRRCLGPFGVPRRLSRRSGVRWPLHPRWAQRNQQHRHRPLIPGGSLYPTFHHRPPVLGAVKDKPSRARKTRVLDRSCARKEGPGIVAMGSTEYETIKLGMRGPALDTTTRHQRTPARPTPMILESFTIQVGCYGHDDSRDRLARSRYPFQPAQFLCSVWAPFLRSLINTLRSSLFLFTFSCQVISFVQPRRRLSSAPTTNRCSRRAQGMSRLAALRGHRQVQPLHDRARRQPVKYRDAMGPLAHDVLSTDLFCKPRKFSLFSSVRTAPRCKTKDKQDQ